MEPAAIVSCLRAEAAAPGIARLGVAAAAERDADRLAAWVAGGRHGTMAYMARQAAVRADPRLLLPGAQAIVCIAVHHDPGEATPPGPGVARLARYARGPDYHPLLHRLLRALVERLDALAPGHAHLLCVDSAPVLERAHAAAAGIGWIGKHTGLVHPRAGSYFLLGEVVTTAPLPADTPMADHCGTCRRCLDACPTGALTAPHQLDARRCISYWTIEHRGALPEAAAGHLAGWVFGCDLCQEVCPFNREVRGGHPDLAPHPYLVAPVLAELAAATAMSFKGQFKGTPVVRAGKGQMARNFAAAARRETREAGGGRGAAPPFPG